MGSSQMDLNDALHSCRCGAHIRDDANMQPGWKIHFVPDPGQPDNIRPHERKGEFYYISPKTGPAYRVTFHDTMKASVQWRTMP
jgi:hypothetical protein